MSKKTKRPTAPNVATERDKGRCALAPGSAFELCIIFPSEEAKRTFATWMSDGGGEQDYFQAMEKSATPSLRIGYHGPEDERYARDDNRRYGAFLADNTLRVEVCGD